ncbi:DNA-entry nuclease [Brevibacillus porteri]|uniref:DNA-entry nuclease n=1 Tax=Brevibacillus porteri TaxID=2126350 RepID=UPI003D25E31F
MVEYDVRGRMLYHPEFHPNQGKRFSDEETAYLCKFYETDSLKSLSLALGRIEKSLEYRIAYLKKTGLFDYYRAKWDRQIKA